MGSVLQEQSAPVWVPHGLQFLPDLLQCGLLSRYFCSCQKPAPVWALHRLQLPSGHTHLLWLVVLHGLQCGYLLCHSTTQAAGKLLLWFLEHLSFCTDFGVCRTASLLFSHSSFSQMLHVFYLLLSTLSQRHHQLGLCTCVLHCANFAAGWNGRCLSEFWALLRGHPCSQPLHLPLQYQNFAT